jgi:hypothetical protein
MSPSTCRVGFCLSLLLGLTAGCGGAREAALSHPAIDTLASGAVVVTNTGPSAWADTAGWHLTLATTIEPAEGSPGELGDIRGLASDTQGNVYVLQSGPATIKVFGPDGAWIRDIGREGDGPGEFRDGMLGLIGDTLLVQDPNNTRLTTFLTDGSFLASHPSQCCWFSSRPLPSFANGTVAIMGPPAGNDDNQSGAYYMTRPDGTAIDTVAMETRSRNDNFEGSWTVRRTSGSSSSIWVTSVPGQPHDVTRWRPDGMLIRGNTADYTLVLGHGVSDTVRVIHASAPQLLLTDAQRDSLYQEAIDGAGPEWRDALKQVAKRSDIPDRRPPWSGLAVDDQNRIWVGLPSDSSEVGSFDVFSPDGVLLGRVASPEPGLVEGIWVGDRVVVESESDLGYPTLRVYRLTRITEAAQ